MPSKSRWLKILELERVDKINIKLQLNKKSIICDLIIETFN